MQKQHPKDAKKYARDVVAGEIPACSYVRLACQRFLSDLKRDDLVFNERKAHRAVSFIEKLPHTKGEWARKRKLLKLEPWQKFIVCNLFGWYKDGIRRFSEVYCEIPRKNGKSMLAAGIGLYMFVEDGEFGAEVYSGATTEKQAMEVFRPMHQMVKRTDHLRQHYDITAGAKTMYITSNGSRCEPIVGNPGDGASPSLAIVDEFHEHKNDDLFDTMQTGMGAREQPIMFSITTAGVNLSGPCYEKRQDVVSILERTVDDDAIFGIIYTVDEGDEWDSEESLIKANPNWGVSKNPIIILRELQAARRSASKQNTFKTRHLDVWCGAKTAWLNMLEWHRAQNKALKLEDFAGRIAFLSVDLAKKRDVAAIGILIPDGRDANGRQKFVTFQDFFAPSEEAEINDKYRQYAAEGWLTLTPGSATDYGMIEERIMWLASHLDVRDVAFDQWQAQYLAQRLMAQGLPMHEFPHQVRTMSDPMKEVDAVLGDKRLAHNGNKMMTWMAGNTVARPDEKENIYPTKSGKANRIDGVVALIMAMGRFLLTAEQGSLDDWLADPVVIS